MWEKLFQLAWLVKRSITDPDIKKTSHTNERKGHKQSNMLHHVSQGEADLSVLTSHSPRHHYISNQDDKMADKGKK